MISMENYNNILFKSITPKINYCKAYWINMPNSDNIIILVFCLKSFVLFNRIVGGIPKFGYLARSLYFRVTVQNFDVHNVCLKES